MNTRITTIYIGLLLIVSLALSGCLTTDVPEPIPEPIPNVTPTVTPTEIPTTMPTVTPTVMRADEPVNKSNWTVCDSRHNESWLYLHKCSKYAGGSGGGRSSSRSNPDPDPDSCEGVTCTPCCSGYDLYNTSCVNGACVQSDLIEANSTCCNYVPPVPEMMTYVMLVYGIFFITMLYVRRGGE